MHHYQHPRPALEHQPENVFLLHLSYSCSPVSALGHPSTHLHNTAVIYLPSSLPCCFFPAYFSVPSTLALCPYHRVPCPPMPYSFLVDPMIPASSSFSVLCSLYITPQNDSQISQTPNHIFILHLLQIYSCSVASSIHLFTGFGCGWRNPRGLLLL